MPEQLPSFNNPPVIETVLGVQFDQLDNFGNHHLGAYWATLDKEEWIRVQEAPALNQIQEQFGGHPVNSPSIRFSIAAETPLRFQIRNKQNDQMIQVQNGWFILNWLAGEEGHSYPRYDQVRKSFDEEWQRFANFIEDQNFGTVRQNLWEVTYVNHFPKDTVWSKPEDLPAILPALVGELGSLGNIQFEDCNSSWRFEIPPEKGRLHVELQRGTRSKGSVFTELIVLKLTARGPIGSDIEHSLENGLNLGRKTIVESFASLTSSESHRYWERTDAN